jgi:hypothetical protein
MTSDRIEISEVNDRRLPFVLIVSTFTVALLITVSAYLIGYVKGQALRCEMRHEVPMNEIARFGFAGGFWE